MKTLIIINDAPYGTEKAWNALRIAMQFQKDFEQAEVRVFLMADGVFCAIPNETTPNGFYNIERMIEAVIHKGGKVRFCTTCGEARGLKSMKLIEGTEWSGMKELTQWIADSDRIINY